MAVVAVGESGERFFFGDEDPEDAVTDGDEKVDWGNLDQLVSRYNEVFDIADPRERLEASKRLVEELSTAA